MRGNVSFIHCLSRFFKLAKILTDRNATLVRTRHTFASRVRFKGAKYVNHNVPAILYAVLNCGIAWAKLLKTKLAYYQLH